MNKQAKFFRLLLTVASVSFLTGCASNKATLTSQSLFPLKQEKAVNVRYDYTGVRVGKFVSEEDYLNQRAAQLDKKEPGRGAQWRKAWVDDRTRRFEPKFESLLNKVMEDEGKALSFGKFPDAKYTLILKTTFMDPGYNAWVSARPSFIDVEATIVETRNPANTLGTLKLQKNRGVDVMGVTFDTGWRLMEAYAKAGNTLGKKFSRLLE